jgi:hypothetical protein
MAFYNHWVEFNTYAYGKTKNRMIIRKKARRYN